MRRTQEALKLVDGGLGTDPGLSTRELIGRIEPIRVGWGVSDGN